MSYALWFDDVAKKQLEKLSRNLAIQGIITKMLHRIKTHGNAAGKIIEPQIGLYEVKSKHPPLRLYYQEEGRIMHIFAIRMKHSQKDQQRTINSIISKIRGLQVYNAFFGYFYGILPSA